jgi:hypothetical protein
MRRGRSTGKPTKAQQAYHEAARELGCVICRFRRTNQAGHTELHHRNFNDWHGGKRVGQDAVVALCRWHHQGDWLHFGWGDDEMAAEYGPSFKTGKSFREWTEEALPDLPGRGTERWQALQDQYLNGGEE